MAEKERDMLLSIKRIQRARSIPYEGTMYEDGRRLSRHREWVNGIRVTDFDTIIAPLLARASSPQEGNEG